MNWDWVNGGSGCGCISVRERDNNPSLCQRIVCESSELRKRETRGRDKGEWFSRGRCRGIGNCNEQPDSYKWQDGIRELCDRSLSRAKSSSSLPLPRVAAFPSLLNVLLAADAQRVLYIAREIFLSGEHCIHTLRKLFRLPSRVLSLLSHGIELYNFRSSMDRHRIVDKKLDALYKTIIFVFIY